jgi:hypothetical protein
MRFSLLTFAASVALAVALPAPESVNALSGAGAANIAAKSYKAASVGAAHSESTGNKATSKREAEPEAMPVRLLFVHYIHI